MAHKRPRHSMEYSYFVELTCTASPACVHHSRLRIPRKARMRVRMRMRMRMRIGTCRQTLDAESTAHNHTRAAQHSNVPTRCSLSTPGYCHDSIVQSASRHNIETLRTGGPRSWKHSSRPFSSCVVHGKIVPPANARHQGEPLARVRLVAGLECMAQASRPNKLLPGGNGPCALIISGWTLITTA